MRGTDVLAAPLEQSECTFMTHSNSSNFDESLWVLALTQNERNDGLACLAAPALTIVRIDVEIRPWAKSRGDSCELSWPQEHNIPRRHVLKKRIPGTDAQ